MYFNTLIATAILASTALAAPASFKKRGNTTSTSTNTLSLTQQLFLADTAVDRFNLLPNDSDFVFDFNNPALKGKGGKQGDLIAANRKTFPPLVSTGMGMAVGFLNGCGFNTPHVHPRSVELQIVTQGRLMTEMVPENGVLDAKQNRRVIQNEVGVNQMTPFYLGSVHTQFNPDCTPATFVAAFNNEDFGAGQIADEFFSLTDDVIEAAFGQAVDGANVDTFRTLIPVSIAKGVEDCLVKCGIQKA
jgi:Cupin